MLTKKKASLVNTQQESASGESTTVQAVEEKSWNAVLDPASSRATKQPKNNPKTTIDSLPRSHPLATG